MDGCSQFGKGADAIMGETIITCIKGTLNRRIKILIVAFLINKLHERDNIRVDFEY